MSDSPIDASATRSTHRFSNRVADYVKARPGYPPGVIDALARAVGFDTSWVVADIGSGTGLSTRLFLENRNVVFAVEPNDAMRSAAEQTLTGFGRFHSLKGISERTTLADASVDLVVAAQAFHWFDRVAFRAECVRILKPGGCVALIWNDRQAGGTPFLDRYEALLHEYGTDYVAVNHRNIDRGSIDAFFAPASCALIEMPSAQRFDFDGLRARLLSSSYAPAADDPRSVPMLASLRALYDDCNVEGAVEMRYTTQVFVGQLK